MNRTDKLMKQVFKKQRPMQEIETECARVAMEAGFKQYEIQIKTEELRGLNDRIRKLNHEGFVVKTKETKVKETAKELTK